MFRRAAAATVPGVDDNVVALVRRTYKSAPVCLKHLADVRAEYATVIVKLEAIHAQSGDHEIVNLVGTFPITFKGNTYKMPLHVRVLPDYPASAPVVFLVPAPNMAIMKNHVNIDQTGRCHFPYLLSWNAANSTLAGLLRVMVQEFSKMPPLYTKPAALPASPPPEMVAQQQAFVPPGFAQVPPQAYGGGPAMGYPAPFGSDQQLMQQQQQQQQQQFVPPGSNAQAFVPPGSNPAAFPPAQQFVPPGSNPAPPQNVYATASTGQSVYPSLSSLPAAPGTPSVAHFVPPSAVQTQQEVKPSKDDDDAADAKLCIVCFEQPKEALIQPCNHIALCMKDANYMKNHKNPCPVCRGPIDGIVRVFLV